MKNGPSEYLEGTHPDRVSHALRAKQLKCAQLSSGQHLIHLFPWKATQEWQANALNNNDNNNNFKIQ